MLFADEAARQAEAGSPEQSATRPRTPDRKRSAGPGFTGETPERQKTAAEWTVAEVVKYLHDLSLEHLSPNFVANGVDGSFLIELSEADLVAELGLTKLQARKIKARLPGGCQQSTSIA